MRLRLRSGKRPEAYEGPEVMGDPGLAVELRGVRRLYGRGRGGGGGVVHALPGVNLALPRGTFTAVTGPSR